jgi:hypothetical protein
MPASSTSTRTRTSSTATGWHAGGPWPGWLRWWYAQGGPARDAAIWSAYLDMLEAGVLRPGQLVADRIGVSRSTVFRAMRRHAARVRGEWPPEVTDGFGDSARVRRARIMRQLGYADDRPILDENQDQARRPTGGGYVCPVPDRYDENGDEAW